LRHQRSIRDHGPRLHPAADDDGIGLGRIAQGRLGFEHDAVHRTYVRRGTGDRDAPAGLHHAVEDAERDQRVEFVEAFEGQDGDVHGESVRWKKADRQQTFSDPRAARAKKHSCDSLRPAYDPN
jgi:hypothetical protein